MTFYLDENLSPHVAEIARARGIDVVSAREAGTTQLDDRSQLLHATKEGRAIVAADVADLTEVAADFIAANLPHARVPQDQEDRDRRAALVAPWPPRRGRP